MIAVLLATCFALGDMVPTQESTDSAAQASLHRDSTEPVLYSFKSETLPLRRALDLFSKSSGLKFVGDAPLEEPVTVSFQKFTRDQALRELLGTRGIQYQVQDNLVTLSAPLGVKYFRIDYLRLKRGGTGSSQASVSSSGSGEAGKISLSTSDEVAFWDEIEGQVKALISESGKMVTNRLAGVMMVKDDPVHLKEVEGFLNSVLGSVARQVELTARIYEITLDKDHSLGVDWSRISFPGTRPGGSSVIGSSKTDLIGQGSSFSAATLSSNFSFGGGSLKAVLEALAQQGEVHAVSQPRLVSLNNQPAMIKVGTDLPYFTSTITKSTVAGIADAIQEEVRVITVGVVLSVTPQIGNDGWIMMGIEPMISTLVGTATSKQGSTAPIVDVKQSSSMVRMADRETLRLSGLIQEKETKNERSVPLLSSIPFLGNLFQWTYVAKERKELVIFLTPVIL